MYLFLVPLLIGYLFVGASSFTAVYCRRFGERRGRIATAVLRNVLGIPLLFVGYIWAWITPSFQPFTPNAFIATLGWVLLLAGVVLMALGHVQIGMRSHLPSMSDTLVHHGLYAHVRHPIYAGLLVMLLGLTLLRPSITVLVATTVTSGCLLLQSRLEEIDLLQRLPQYRDYVSEVPRFVPRLRRSRRKSARSEPGNPGSADASAQSH